MKNIILLEDNLDIAEEFAEQLRKWTEQGKKIVTVNKILFYDDNLCSEKIDQIDAVQHLRQIGLDVEWVNVINFNTVMNRLYQDDNNLFIFDTYLLSDDCFFFKERINVNYALQKIEDKRIWFYTTAGDEIKGCIDLMFPDKVMKAETIEKKHVLHFKDNQEFIRKAMG